MKFKHEKDSKDLSSSTNSNSNLDYDHESSIPSSSVIRFIDNLDENNNNSSSNNINNNNSANCANRNSVHFHPPVKFVTHFTNIKEDED